MLYFAVGLERIREEEENKENEENEENKENKDKGTENEASKMGKESTLWTREQREHNEKDQLKETITMPDRRGRRRGGDDNWRKPSTIERNALFLAGKVHARRGEIREAIATLTSLAHRQPLGWTGPHSTKRYLITWIAMALFNSGTREGLHAAATFCEDVVRAARPVHHTSLPHGVKRTPYTSPYTEVTVPLFEDSHSHSHSHSNSNSPVPGVVTVTPNLRHDNTTVALKVGERLNGLRPLTTPTPALRYVFLCVVYTVVCVCRLVYQVGITNPNTSC